MQIGDLEVEFVSAGCFRMDGGSMFGVIPKSLWSRVAEFDLRNPKVRGSSGNGMWSRVAEIDLRNRMQLRANCLLVRSRDKNVLIETGVGTGLSDREQDIFDVDAGDPLLESSTNDVDDGVRLRSGACTPTETATAWRDRRPRRLGDDRS